MYYINAPHALYYDILNTTCQLLSSVMEMVKAMARVLETQKPQERRPIMAHLTNHFSRSYATKLLEFPISKREWWNSKIHAKYPGALKPIEVIKTTRQHFNMEHLVELLGHLDEEHLQKHAYGAKDYTSKATGALIQLDAVSTTSSTRRIIQQYDSTFGPGQRPAESLCKRRDTETNRPCSKPAGHGGDCHFLCKKQEKTTNRACSKPANHDGYCRFTPEEKYSLSSIKRILGAVTKGHLKSKAGLDDEDVMKGSNNVERLHEIFDRLSTELELGPQAVKMMKSRISFILDYHKTDFIAHLSREANRQCQCISCGLHTNNEPIHCPYRVHCEKLGPCNDCEKSFDVFTDLLRHSREAQNKDGLTAQQIEPFVELEAEIQHCRSNLMDWRSHIVRKKVESGFSRDRLRSLKKNQAIVIADFKMKILPMYFRENQRLFFGKRGTACLGFMVISNTKEKTSGVDVSTIFFFSDDTLQDSQFVLAGKAYIYNEFLPKEFPDIDVIETEFESDGAGAFNSNMAKACMPYWYEWSNGRVEEVEIRHCVNGDGKSTLDGSFGRLGCNFREAVNNRVTDIINAETCLAAYEGSGGIRGATAAILRPDRTNKLEIVQNIPRLLTSHRLVLDRSKREIRSYSNSGYGDGISISFDDIDAMWSKASSEERMVAGDASSNEEDDDDHLTREDNTNHPKKPGYLITLQTETTQSKDKALHPFESHSSRTKKARTTKRAANLKQINDNHGAKVTNAVENGLYYCSEVRRDDLAACRAGPWLTKQGLDSHMARGVHDFPTRRNLTDAAAFLASGDNGILATGGRRNRNGEHTVVVVADGVGNGANEGTSWYETGCYCKPGRAPAKRLKQELKDELIRMYKDGENTTGGKGGRNKYTAIEAREELRIMKQKGGLNKFSSTSEYGDLPSIDQIKSFWSRYKSSTSSQVQALRNPKKSNYTTPEEIGEWVDDALEPPEFLVGDTPVTYYNDCKNDARLDNSVGLCGSLVGNLDGSLDGGLGGGLDGGSGGDGSYYGGLGGSLCSRDNSVIENMLFVLEKAFKKLPEAESVTSAINRNNGRVMSSLAKNSEYPSCLASPLLLIQAC